MLSGLSVLNQLLLVWAVPSLSLFLLFLQLRHLDHETIPEFFRYQDNTPPILMIVIWPMTVLAIVIVGTLLPILLLIEKTKVNLNFLVTDFKFK